MLFISALLILTLSIVGANLTNDTETGIIFPPECKNQDICYVKPKNYPEHKFHSVLKKLDLKRIPRSAPYYASNHGFVDDDYADKNCRAQYEIRVPFGIKVSNIMRPVIQMPYFEQKIRYVTCEDEGAECMDGVIDPISFKATCSTMYAQIQLHIYNPDINNIEIKDVPIPVSCNCNIKDV